VKFLVSIFKFFASLKLAIALLLSLAGLFSLGTFVESTYGTEAAKLAVYQSPWMSFFLILLALNVAAAALDRLPWKKKHTGFVVTHAGILLLLVGSLVTRAYGVEGQMAIAEGQTASRIILNESIIQLFSPDSGPLGSARVPPKAFPWKGREPLPILGLGPSLPEVFLLRYFPKSRQEESIQDSSDGPAALQVTLESSFMKVSHWLLLGDPERSRISLGPAELRFVRDPLPIAKKESSEEEFLEFQFEDSAVKTEVPQKTPKKIPLKGTPYQVTVLRVLKDAMVDRGQLIDRSGEWENPAVELLLEGKGIKEKHTVFSKFPDFPTIHGLKPSAARVRIFYRRPEALSGASKNELRFVWRETSLPLYQIRKAGAIVGETVELGKEYATGWMDFKFRIEKYYPQADANSVFFEEPVQSQSEDHLSAAQVELAWHGERRSLWLGQGNKKTISLGGRSLLIVYGLRMLPIGFRLELKDFRIDHDPGTSRPASFQSDVTLKDDFTGTVRDVTIRMNQPLKHRGFKIFQSGYQQPEGGPEVSIFTVAKDPGIPLKYLGALVMIGGILTMFYSKRFSNREAREKKEAVLLK